MKYQSGGVANEVDTECEQGCVRLSDILIQLQFHQQEEEDFNKEEESEDLSVSV